MEGGGEEGEGGGGRDEGGRREEGGRDEGDGEERKEEEGREEGGRRERGKRRKGMTSHASLVSPSPLPCRWVREQGEGAAGSGLECQHSSECSLRGVGQRNVERSEEPLPARTATWMWCTACSDMEPT